MNRLLIFVFILLAYIESTHAQVQNSDKAGITPDSFLKQLEGTWKLEILNDKGREIKLTPNYKDDVVRVKGCTINFLSMTGEHPYRMEDISVQNGLVYLTLVSSQEGKKSRFQAIAKLDDGLFVFARHRFRADRPESIAPSEESTVQTWRKEKQDVTDP